MKSVKSSGVFGGPAMTPTVVNPELYRKEQLFTSFTPFDYSSYSVSFYFTPRYSSVVSFVQFNPTVLWIRIDFNADPDPVLDPDPGFVQGFVQYQNKSYNVFIPSPP